LDSDGLIALNAKQYEQAIHAFKEAIHLNPEDADAWHGLGVAHELLEQFEESPSDFKEAVKYAPKDKTFWLYRPQCRYPCASLIVITSVRAKWRQSNICISSLSAAIVLRIDLCEVFPFVGEIIEREYGRHRAHRNASTTVNAFHWVNVELRCVCEFQLILTWVNAINGAGVDARGVFGSDTRFSNHVSHGLMPPVDKHRRGCCTRK